MLRPGICRNSGAKGPRKLVAHGPNANPCRLSGALTGHKGSVSHAGKMRQSRLCHGKWETQPGLLPCPGVGVHPGFGRVPTRGCLPAGRGCSSSEGLSSAPQPCHHPSERPEGTTCATATCVCCCCCCRSCWRSCIWWWAERGVPRSGSWTDEGSSILGDAVRMSSGWRQPCKTPVSKL